MEISRMRTQRKDTPALIMERIVSYQTQLIFGFSTKTRNPCEKKGNLV
jgi:hypothetical protein